MKSLKEELLPHIQDPRSVVLKSIESLERELSGINILDTVNPFMWLLEASAMNTASAIDHHISTLNKLYPNNNTTDDVNIYRHMSDADLRDRWAKPSSGRFGFAIEINSLNNEVLPNDEADEFKYVEIPKNTTVSVDGIQFILNNAIEIRIWTSGLIDVVYSNKSGNSARINSLISTVTSDSNNVTWLRFEVTLEQTRMIYQDYSISIGSKIDEKIEFTDGFSRMEVLLNKGGEWNPIPVRYDAYVFDKINVSANAEVHDTMVNVTLPPFYQLTRDIGTEMRSVVYSTHGDIVVDLSNYTVEDFRMNINPVTERLGEHGKAFGYVSTLIQGLGLTYGGREALSKDDFRRRFVENELGSPSTPITFSNVVNLAKDSGFGIKEIRDGFKNRTYVLTKLVPNVIYDDFPHSISVREVLLLSNRDKLVNKRGVSVGDNGLTITPDAIIKDIHKEPTMLSETEYADLTSLSTSELANKFNIEKHWSLLFYYSLQDTGSRIQADVYDANSPTIDTVEFIIKTNNTPNVATTGSWTIEKVEEGYKVNINTNVNNQAMTLVVTDTIYGDLQYPVTIENNTVDSVINYSFIIHTKTLFTLDHMLLVGDSPTDISKPIKEKHSLYLQYRLGSTLVTKEKVNLNLFTRLINMWNKIEIHNTKPNYLRYKEDVPYIHVTPKFERYTNGSIVSIDAGCNISYDKIADAGDVVLDASGNPSLKHRKGEIVMSGDEPVLLPPTHSDWVLSLTTIPSLFYFTNDPVLVEYRETLKDIMITESNYNAEALRNVIHDSLDVKYLPTTTAGSDLDRSGTVTCVVDELVYDDKEKQDIISRLTISTVDTLFDSPLVTKSDLISELRKAYGIDVIDFEVDGILNENIVDLTDTSDRLSVANEVGVSDGGNLVIKSGIRTKFIKIT